MNDKQPSEILADFLTEERREKMNRALEHRLRGITVVLENLYDPHNISAILRSAEALGIQDIYVIEREHKFKFSSGITRGCEKWLTIRRFESPQECAAVLRAAEYEIVIADHRPETPRIEALDPMRKRAFWMGAEHAGVSDDARQLADGAFRIPMNGFSESFNVSVASALTMYAARTRWETVTGKSGDLGLEERESLRLGWLRRDISSADAILDRFDVGGDRKSWRTRPIHTTPRNSA